MKDFVSKLLNGNVLEAKEILQKKLDELADEKLTHRKAEIALSMFDVLDEANVVKTGRTKVIKVRFRRNAKGRIVVQKNTRRSGIKGYRISGNTVKRIPATVRLRKARLLKRSWKTTRRAKLRRSLMKRKMSMRRRLSIGLK